MVYNLLPWLTSYRPADEITNGRFSLNLQMQQSTIFGYVGMCISHVRSCEAFNVIHKFCDSVGAYFADHINSVIFGSLS